MTILLTPRLRLEPYEDRHLDGLLAIDSDPEVMRYITGKPRSREDVQATIGLVKAWWKSWGYSWWAFIDRETGEVVGGGCIQHLGKDQMKPLEIGWRLRRDHWGKGLASEAARRMTRFAFDYLASPELTAVCDPDNRDSAKVMERLGMRYRGIERWYDTDCAVYGITADEWHASPEKAKATAEAQPDADELAANERPRAVEL